jgi:diguanylate cyclase (GGDEF)-like protein
MERLAMKHSATLPSPRLRVRPLVLVALSVLGLAAAQASWQSYSNAREEAIRAELAALSFARAAASHQDALLEQTSNLLRVLGGISLPETRDPIACRDFLARQLDRFPAYENLAFLHADGRVQCSARPLSFSISMPALEGTAGAQGKPLLLSFQSGSVAAVLAPESPATINGEHGDTVAAIMPLREWILGNAPAVPHDAAFAILDNSGRVLATHPSRSDWLSADPLFSQTLLALDSGIPTRLSITPDREHLYVAQPLSGVSQPLRLVVRLPADAAADLSRSAALLVAAFALTAFTLWLLGRIALQHALAVLRRIDWKPLGRWRPWVRTEAALRSLASAHPFRQRSHAPAETTMLRAAYNDLKRAFAEGEDRMRQLVLLDELSRTLQGCQNMSELGQAVAHCATALFPGSNGVLLRSTPNRMEKILAWGVSSTSTEIVAEYIEVPLAIHDEILGALRLVGIDDSQHWAFTSLAERAAAGMAAIKRQEQLRSRAMRDGLTGLYNRRFMEEALGIEQRRALRRGTSIGVLIIDIDHFKRFNDTYGHDAGDILLRGMGALLRRAVREGDMPCRYGGEEFVVILPGADLAGAQQRAEALRQAIAQWNPQRDGQALGPATISIGVAALPMHGGTWTDVLKAADEALYRSKRAGRNRVTTAPIPTPRAVAAG